MHENCYVVSDDSKEAMIVDCGAYTDADKQAVLDYIRSNDLIPRCLVQTHGHLDHCIGNSIIYKEFGLKPEVHANEVELMSKLAEQSEMMFYEPLKEEIPPVGRYFTDKDTITFGNHVFTIIDTPGHTPGGVFLYCKEESLAFSGDTLFRGSIGRTDLMGGSMFQIIQSLRTVCQLPDDTKIYPGHGETTNIGYECATNMYIDR